MTSTYFGIELDSVTDTLGYLGCSECSPAAQKWFIQQLPAPRVIENWAPHQLDRFLCWMIELLFLGAAHDELRRRRVPYGRVLTRLPEPRRILLADVPAGLVLEPVVRAREYRPAFVPDDLLMMNEPDGAAGHRALRA